MIASLLAPLLLVPALLTAPPVDEALPRSKTSSKELEKVGKEVDKFFSALAEDRRGDQQEALDEINKQLDKIGKKLKTDTMLRYLGDIDAILELAKPTRRELKPGKGFFVHEFVDGFDDVTVASLLSLPKEYGRSDAPFPVIVGLKAPLGQSGPDLEEQVQAMAEAMYGPLLETHIVLIPIGRQTVQDRDTITGEVEGSWLTDDGLYTFFTAFRTLLEQVRFDRARVVLDGWSDAGIDAYRLAAAAPSFFAGVVNRSGDASAPDLILENLVTMPTLYVRGEEDGAVGEIEPLEAAGVDVAVVQTSGSALAPPDDAAGEITAWIEARQRPLAPEEILFKTGDLRFASVNWCQASEINRRVTAKPSDPDFPSLHARIDRGANSIDIDTVNVLELRVFLSDALVDLDKPVTINVNGEQRIKKAFRRDLRFLLENRFYSNSGDYGLYTDSFLIENIDPNLPPAEDADDQ